MTLRTLLSMNNPDNCLKYCCPLYPGVSMILSVTPQTRGAAYNCVLSSLIKDNDVNFHGSVASRFFCYVKLLMHVEERKTMN